MTYYPPDDPFFTPCCGVGLCGDIELSEVVCPYCGENIFKPLTEEEAQAAFDEAEPIPISDEEIHRIVEKTTNPNWPKCVECGRPAEFTDSVPDHQKSSQGQQAYRTINLCILHGHHRRELVGNTCRLSQIPIDDFERLKHEFKHNQFSEE